MIRRRRPVAAVAALALLSACGSGLTHQELLRANTEALQATAAVAPAEGNADASAPTTPVPNDTASPVAAEAGAAPSAAARVPSDGGRTASPAVSSRVLPSSGAPLTGGVSTSDRRNPTPAPPGSPATGPGTAPATPGQSGAPSPPVDPAGPKGDLVLGSFGEESGPLGAVVLPILEAAKAWANDINSRGGVAGRRVRLVMADDGGEPGRALALAKRMVEEDHVVAFYAVHSLTTLQAVTPYLEQRKVPIIGACECNTEVDRSPMVFHPGLGATLAMHWGAIAPLVELSDKRKVAILYCREVSTCTQIKDGVEQLAPSVGIKVVYETQVSIAQPDFTAEVIAARNAGAEVVLPTMDMASQIRAIRSARRQGWNPEWLLFPAGYDSRLLHDGGGDVEGAMVSSVTAAWSDSPVMADYRAAMDRYAPAAPRATLGAENWVAGRILEKVVLGIPGNPKPADIIEGLYGLKGETLGGALPPIAFERDKGHVATNQCVISAKVEGGRFVAPTGRFTCRPGWKPVGQ